ncbi:hypothetical protein RB195_015922 [Necator americanus]|uniref:Uncharacterized protein n=1 Tax=Necator americanus TaxID=51031 RepID=A0ABR1E6S7_NECAM
MVTRNVGMLSERSCDPAPALGRIKTAVQTPDLNDHVRAMKDGCKCHGGFGYGSRDWAHSGDRRFEQPGHCRLRNPKVTIPPCPLLQL